jgi:4-hydroxybenzoate polyprenyltransferase
MKYRKTVYWILTVIFAAMMLFSSILYLSHQPPIVQAFHRLGYPDYLLGILGTAKIIGVISLIQTKFSLLKEWAYAGFTINLVAASWSHLAVGESIVMPLILFLVLAGSYIFRKQISEIADEKAGNTLHRFA